MVSMTQTTLQKTNENEWIHLGRKWVRTEDFPSYTKKIKGGMNMPEKKMPSYRLVIGKSTIGTLWTAQSKAGRNYFSGTLDLDVLRRVLSDSETKKVRKQVRIDRSGNTAEHELTRVAMFPVELRRSSSAGF